MNLSGTCFKTVLTLVIIFIFNYWFELWNLKSKYPSLSVYFLFMFFPFLFIFFSPCIYVNNKWFKDVIFSIKWNGYKRNPAPLKPPDNHSVNWCLSFHWFFRWTYADPSWARIAALVPEVVSCAEACDQVATKILVNAVQDLALSVKAVVQRLHLCGEGANLIWLYSFKMLLKINIVVI
jgi:hypothetical protein